MSSRSLNRYVNPGHPFSFMPLHVVNQIIARDGNQAGSLQYYFNHFLHWEGPVGDAAAPGTGGWIVTSVDSLAGAGESVDVLDSARYGILRIITNAGDNDNTQIQMNGSPWRYSVGQRMVCAARIALQDADDGEAAFGLILETDVDMLNTLPADGIFFEKAETAVDFDFHVRKDGTSTERTSALGLTLANDTFVIIGFYVNESGGIVPFSMNDTSGKITEGTAVPQGTADIPNDEDLTLAFQIQTGAVATRYMDIDWVFVGAEHA